MHPRGCNGLHAICKCVGQVAFQRFLRIPLVTTLPPIFFARFVRLTLAEWTFQSWLALGRRFKEEYYYYYYYWKLIKLRMYYWNLCRMFSTSCKLWFQIFWTILKRKEREISSSIRAIEFSAILRVQKIGVSPSHDLRLINVSHPIPTNIRRRGALLRGRDQRIKSFPEEESIFYSRMQRRVLEEGEKERRHWCRGLSYDTIVTLISLDDVWRWLNQIFVEWVSDNITSKWIMIRNNCTGFDITSNKTNYEYRKFGYIKNFFKID